MSVFIPDVECQLRVITRCVLVEEIVLVSMAGVECRLRVLTCCVLVGEIMSGSTAGVKRRLCVLDGDVLPLSVLIIWVYVVDCCWVDWEGQLCILLSIGASLSIIAEN